jgi:hypothetical protein
MFYGSDKIVPRNHKSDITLNVEFVESFVWVNVTSGSPVTITVLSAGAGVNGAGATADYIFDASQYVPVVCKKVTAISGGVVGDLNRLF